MRGLTYLLVLALVTATMVAVLSAVAAMIPDEQVPRIASLDDGTTEYCIQSLENAILAPVGFPLGAALVFAGVFFLARRFPDRVHGGDRPPLVVAVFRWAFYAVAAALMAALFLATVIVRPCHRYRSVIVGADRVTFVSLYRTWDTPRSQIRAARVSSREDGSRAHRILTLAFEVVDEDGRVYRSVDISGLDQSARADRVKARQVRDVLNRLAEDLRPHDRRRKE
jgi:hypothetical protein